MKRFLLALAAAAALALPAAASADAVYTVCYGSCNGELNAIDSTMPNVAKVLNVGAQSLNLGDRISYNATAAANGQKLIWPIPTNWPCNGPASPNVADRVDSLKGWSATWGFYVGEEATDASVMPCAGTVLNHTTKPSLYTDGPRDTSRISQADLDRYATHRYQATVFGVECYPVKDAGTFDPNTCDAEARAVRDLVQSSNADAVTTTWAVPQAFAWSDDCYGEVDCPNSNGPQGPYPTWTDQCAMRRSMDPYTAELAWFSYYLMTVPTYPPFHAPLNARAQLSSVIGDPRC